jgi:hypothetical protein
MMMMMMMMMMPIQNLLRLGMYHADYNLLVLSTYMQYSTNKKCVRIAQSADN